MSYYSGLPMPAVPGAPPLTGKYFFVDPVNGSDGNKGDGPGASKALKTLYKAHALCTSGKHDTVFLIGNGAQSGSAILSLANAVSVDATATTGTLTWSKSATHLVGVGAYGYNSRSRISPPTTTYTQNTFNSGNLVVVSGNGCHFQGINFVHEFTTGGTNQICLTVSGLRNVFEECSIFGMVDAASAQDTGSRDIKITGAENTFRECYIGLGTIARTVANASVEFSSTSCKRNVFDRCWFEMYATTLTTQVHLLVSTAGFSDRWQLFRDCIFFNNKTGSSTTAAAVASLAASIGGILVLKNCSRFNMTDWASDATGLAQMYLEGTGDEAQAGDEIGRGIVAIAT